MEVELWHIIHVLPIVKPTQFEYLCKIMYDFTDKTMKTSKLLLLISMLLFALPAMSQTAEEIATVRSVAKKMGYSEKDINAVLGGKEGIPSTNLTSQTAEIVPDESLEPQVMVLPTAAQKSSDENASANLDYNPDAIYGHNYFISAGVGTVTSYNAPAPASYILGPGDEVIVDVWGATVSHVVATIQNDGSIQMPDLGPLYLAGMNIEKAEASLKSQLARIYSGLSEDRGDTFARLSIGKMKGIVVNVSGEVTTPGAYTVPSLASLPSTIYSAGGVSETGSVRNITLYRRGKAVAHFDLYEYLFKGQLDENIRLQDGDVVNVEPYKNVARIDGAVMRSMRYEFKDGETVADLIYFAGGFSTEAQKNGVHISRRGIDANKDFDLDEREFKSFNLYDGDVVSVRSYKSFDENSVTLIGPVKFPGNYAKSTDIYDVASLIKAAGGLIEGAFTGYGQINRLDANRQPTYLTFNLEEILNGKTKVDLCREDRVVIYSHDDFVSNQSVRISGAIENPGLYSFHSDMNVRELIDLAGGLSDDAYLARGVVSHYSSNGQPATTPFNVVEAENVILNRNDAVHIYSIEDLKKESTVSIYGEVNAPGVFVYRESMTIKDIVDLAMGFTDGVDMTNVQLVSRGGRTRGTIEILDLESYPELINRVLKPYDAISFRRLTYFRDMASITVSGEVFSPGDYVVDKAEVRISDVMARTGGFTDEAYPHGARIVRVLNEEEIERERRAVMIANQSLDEKTQINVATLLDRYTIGIDIEEAIKHPGSNADVILRDGDIIEVPQMNNTVKITGGVLYPNTVVYNKSMSWRDYVNQAGGFKKAARKSKTYAIYMNGKVAAGSKIYSEPGMEIIVPERSDSERTKLSPVEIASLASSATSITALIGSILTAILK